MEQVNSVNVDRTGEVPGPSPGIRPTLSFGRQTVDFKEKWAGIRKTIENVLKPVKVQRSEWNDRFADIFSLCMAIPEPYTAQLYGETREFLKGYVKGLLTKITADPDPSKLLRCYLDMWRAYSDGVEVVNQLYTHVNQRVLVRKLQAEPDESFRGDNFYAQLPGPMVEFRELGLGFWRTEMLEKVQTSLIELVLEAIRESREGTLALTSTALGHIIRSFASVEKYPKETLPGDPTTRTNFYDRAFEGLFLRDTGHYYLQEGNKLAETYNVSQYMEKVIHKLRVEELRARGILHYRSHGKLRTECHKGLLGDHVPMLEAEFKGMLESELTRDLANMYFLLKLVPKNGLAFLAQTFEEHVRRVGSEGQSNLRPETAHMDFVENFISVYQKYKDIVNGIFRSNPMFLAALDKACASVINQKNVGQPGPCRSPELLAKYCDALLKKSTKNEKGLSGSEVDEKLGHAITIFKYLEDKDVFEKFYARNLARRLIHHLSQSMDWEEGMICRLKVACGYDFTNTFHRMLTDVSLSQDLRARFRAHVKNNGIVFGIPFDMLVLQTGIWPLQPPLSPLAMPLVIERAVISFEGFYRTQFNGRNLSWLLHLSTCEVKVSQYLKRTYFIMMQTLQMALLLQFELSDSLTYLELAQASQLNDEQMRINLLSLVAAKLLVVGEGEKELTPESVISLNKGYVNKKSRLRINTAAAPKEAPKEEEEDRASVQIDRKGFLQAAIVRIMKSRKVLKHNILIEEVISMSAARFSPEISLIKKTIEGLIEREYLERNPDSADEYSYVA